LALAPDGIRHRGPALRALVDVLHREATRGRRRARQTAGRRELRNTT
jgi:hypothetical protein